MDAISLSTSHARGATDQPLIKQTIGDFFAQMAARQLLAGVRQS